MCVLVGGSSTGKSRCLAHLVGKLNGSAAGWVLLHPRSNGDLLRILEAGTAAPRTVLWLNELQRYLLAPDAQEVAGQLAALLADRSRGPVLVLGTLWPEHRDALTSRPGALEPDPHAGARALLEGRCVWVPEQFTDEDLRELVSSSGADARLALARDYGGRDITQFLAGGRELLARYQGAAVAARALMDAAMDARRMGSGPLLPGSFLGGAATGYISDRQWQLLPDDWLDGAFAYVGQACKGVPGPLTAHRPRLGDPGPGFADTGYLLADYLEHHGRDERRTTVPPLAFWEAALAGSLPAADLVALGAAALERWLLRLAVQLYARPAQEGDPAPFWGSHARTHGWETHSGRRSTTSGPPTPDRTSPCGSRPCSSRPRGPPRALELLRRAAEDGDLVSEMMVAVESMSLEDKAAGERERREELRERARAEGYHDAVAYLSALTARSWTEEGRAHLKREASSCGYEGEYDYLSGLWLTAADTEAEERAYREAARAGHPEALHHLAYLAERREDGPGSSKLLQQACDAGRRDAAELAWRFERDGDLVQAASWFERVVRDGDKESLLDLACLRLQAGDRDGALRLYWQAAGAGLGCLAWQARQEQARWREVCPYGFEPDGSVAVAW
ncbi:hypothetical protein GXW82_44310 [Streptacidiphilus sp. 4-A2]|nr:hypothetical protein [Streptacidiphilus sp. 4-A2]